MTEENNFWESILKACDADLRGKATLEQKELLVQNVDAYINALRVKKKEIECQFTSHRAIMQEYHQDYVNGDIDKSMYFECVSEEKMWKSKAVSYLTRIEVKLMEINANKCTNNTKEMTSLNS